MEETEKKKLEKSALDHFLIKYSRKLKILKHDDKPDFTLLDLSDNQKIGAEISHLFFDSREAKMLLGRSEQNRHGTMTASSLIGNLNNLIINKNEKIKGFAIHDKFFLIIRTASPIFDRSTFDLFEKNIDTSKSEYDEIWLICNEDTNRWGAIKKIK